jgi:hypothetical protein
MHIAMAGCWLISAPTSKREARPSNGLPLAHPPFHHFLSSRRFPRDCGCSGGLRHLEAAQYVCTGNNLSQRTNTLPKATSLKNSLSVVVCLFGVYTKQKLV